MNADYEHALLRLLSGERDLVRLEPASARDAIERELDSSNPNVGMYREYAGCDVWVSNVPGYIDNPDHDALFAAVLDDDEEDDEDYDDDAGYDDADSDSGWSTADAPGADIDDDAADVISNVATFEMAEDANQAEPEDADAVEASETGRDRADGEVRHERAAGGRCAYCDSALPTHRAVRFCPYCGADQTTRPCDSCGESLEPGWTFCIACGAARGDAG